MNSPYSRSHANALEEEKLLATLAQHGSLSFHRLSRRAFPDLGMRQADNVVRRCANAGEIETSDHGPKVWSLTDKGRDRLAALPLNARIGAQHAEA